MRKVPWRITVLPRQVLPICSLAIFREGCRMSSTCIYCSLQEIRLIRPSDFLFCLWYLYWNSCWLTTSFRLEPADSISLINSAVGLIFSSSRCIIYASGETAENLSCLFSGSTSTGILTYYIEYIWKILESLYYQLSSDDVLLKLFPQWPLCIQIQLCPLAVITKCWGTNLVVSGIVLLWSDTDSFLCPGIPEKCWLPL